MTGVIQNDVVGGDRFDMELCIRKFVEHYAEMLSERDTEFIECEGCLLFLSYCLCLSVLGNHWNLHSYSTIRYC